MVHRPQPVAVGVPGDAQVQAQRRDRVGQIHHRRRLLRIRNVRPPRHHRVMNRVRRVGQRRQRRRPGAPHHPVARIHRHAQPAARKPRREHFEIVGHDVAVVPRGARRRAPLTAPRHRRNLIAQQRRSPRPKQLEAVVFRRIVARRNDQPPAQPQLIHRPANHRRRAEPQPFNRNPRRSQPADHRLIQLRRRRPRIPPHRRARPPAPLKPAGKPPRHPLRRPHINLPRRKPPNVISANSLQRQRRHAPTLKDIPALPASSVTPTLPPPRPPRKSPSPPRLRLRHPRKKVRQTRTKKIRHTRACRGYLAVPSTQPSPSPLRPSATPAPPPSFLRRQEPTRAAAFRFSPDSWRRSNAA